MLIRRTLLGAVWRRRGDHRGCYRRVCRQCGAVFYTSRPEARYCRAACRQRAYRRRRRRLASQAGPRSQERDPATVAAGSREVKKW